MLWLRILGVWVVAADLAVAEWGDVAGEDLLDGALAAHHRTRQETYRTKSSGDLNDLREERRHQLKASCGWVVFVW